MSAIAHHAPTIERGERRAHLVLLPTGRDAVQAARAARSGRTARAAGLTNPPLRLTRLGRLVVTLIVATAVALLGVGLAGQLATASSAPRPVTVVSGDTLSQIAARELPGLPISDAVIEIQLANGLSTSQIHAGQTLLVPTP
ncbi:LysM domain-containing protein [Humibacillus xanthopallidus]|uniref:LysM domain-containing protein n=1 Tax=Humibacillus xanthopallidus TaxID=412689 RepID=A0A543PWB1_9MICO|nr:LysM peptidoglycan-binding domain-containing protein [Humibacillus xanthopallidus]TQN48356.1 LysM domain-containing protein [Humibacillus xanthopallidus]